MYYIFYGAKIDVGNVKNVIPIYLFFILKYFCRKIYGRNPHYKLLKLCFG